MQMSMRVSMRVRTRPRRWLAAIGVAALTATVTTVATAPAGAATDSFFTYTGSAPLSSYQPGDVLKTRTLKYSLDGIKLPLDVTQLLYRTTDAQGRPTANVTSVLRTPLAKTTNKAIAYGSFYDSLNPEDGPSRGVVGSTNIGAQTAHVETLIAVPFLLQGYSVIVADTQGPTADFAAGPEYGYTTLDSIRAVAAASASTGVSTDARVGLIGYSGGAIATNWAAALAPSYAPDVNSRLVGAAEGGVLVFPAHNLDYVSGSLVWAGVAPMALIGAARAYGIDFAPYLSEYGAKVVAKLEKASIAQALGAYPGLTFAKLVKPQYADPTTIPPYVETVNKLNLGSAPTPTVPMFIGQGSNGLLEGTKGIGKGDGVMVAGDVRALARQYCRTNTKITYTQYDLTSHFTSALLWIPSAVAWMTARFANIQPPTNCGAIKPGNSLAPLTVTP